uniref:GCK domain-containing protein n=1 Tax=Ditylum brightwellii TaxID=49249 RepID=A0A7S4S5B1_9STRA
MPCQFGSSIRTFATDATSSKNPSIIQNLIQQNKNTEEEDGTTIEKEKERTNCPLCKKYSRGPCGTYFKDWLKCTDENPGKNPDNPSEDLHLTKCADLAKALADCLNLHDEYYKNDDTAATTTTSNNDEKESMEEGEEEEGLKQAWNEFIQTLEQAPSASSSDRKQIPFPSSIKPNMQLRVESSMGMAMFHSEYDPAATTTTASFFSSSFKQKSTPNKKKTLLLAYIKDQNGNILGAGSKEDLYALSKENNNDGDLILRFSIVKDESISITACALYEAIDDDDDEGERDNREEGDCEPIYVYTQLLPPKHL